MFYIDTYQPWRLLVFLIILSRFLPPGSYLNAYALGAKKLAKTMNDIINDKEKYYDFFRWHEYYSFHAPNESADTDEVCGFCAYLNDEKRKYETFVYDNISEFWSCNLEQSSLL